MTDLKEIVNTELYPIDSTDKDSLKYSHFVNSVREKYHEMGIATLPGFLSKDALAAITKEVTSKSEKVWMTHTKHNIFVDDGNINFANDHVRNKLFETKCSSLAYDNLDLESPLRILYKSEDLCEFLRRVLGLPELHRVEDSLGACHVNVFTDGNYNSWHFDESPFTASIMLQKPKRGGIFQLTKPIESYGLSKKMGDNIFDDVGQGLFYDFVSGVVQKDMDDQEPPQVARDLEFEPGTLSIFQGKQCLHRVTKCYGDQSRLVAILCFSPTKGTRNSHKVQEMFWGRTD